MTGRIRLLFVLILLAFSTGHVSAQPIRGVVWTQPADLDLARADLRRMKELGVQAVRTGIVESEELLALADRLELQIYQELPAVHWPSAAFRDSLQSMMQRLDRAIGRARAHPSARHFGLAYGGDTADPSSCSYFTALTNRVHQVLGTTGRTYYTTVLPEIDRCASRADLVLVDLRYQAGLPPAHERWEEYRQIPGARSVGVAAVGYPVSSEKAFGLRHPSSPQSQARYLETALSRLFTAPDGPAVLFAYEWRDLGRAYLPDNPFGESYGMIGPDGKARPAFSVLAGFYTGKQKVFAFPAGSPPPSGTPWTILIGWVLVIGLALYYMFSARLRIMVPRYFLAHGFYRDAVREGRDLLLGSSMVLLVALGYSLGMMLTLIFKAASGHQAYAALFSTAPADARQGIDVIATVPLMLILIAGVIYAFSAIIWSSILALLSRGRYFLQPGQALMLVTWPRWPLLLLMIATMVVAPLPLDELRIAALAMLAAWLIFSVFAFLRTLYDYMTITRVPFVYVLTGMLLNPGVLLILFLALVVVLNWSEVQYLSRFFDPNALRLPF